MTSRAFLLYFHHFMEQWGKRKKQRSVNDAKQQAKNIIWFEMVIPVEKTPKNLLMMILECNFQLHMCWALGSPSVANWIVNTGFSHASLLPLFFPKNCLFPELLLMLVSEYLLVLGTSLRVAFHRPQSRGLSLVTSPWILRHHWWVRRECHVLACISRGPLSPMTCG